MSLARLLGRGLGLGSRRRWSGGSDGSVKLWRPFSSSTFKDESDRKHLFDKLEKMKAEKKEGAKREAEGKSMGMALAEGAGPSPSKNEMVCRSVGSIGRSRDVFTSETHATSFP